jgi:hypothetical protein
MKHGPDMEDDRVAWLVDAGCKGYGFKFAGKGVPYYSWTLNFIASKDAMNAYKDEEGRLNGAGKLKYLIHLSHFFTLFFINPRRPFQDPWRRSRSKTARGREEEAVCPEERGNDNRSGRGYEGRVWP